MTLVKTGKQSDFIAVYLRCLYYVDMGPGLSSGRFEILGQPDIPSRLHENFNSVLKKCTC